MTILSEVLAIVASWAVAMMVVGVAVDLTVMRRHARR